MHLTPVQVAQLVLGGNRALERATGISRTQWTQWQYRNRPSRRPHGDLGSTTVIRKVLTAASEQARPIPTDWLIFGADLSLAEIANYPGWKRRAFAASAENS